MIDDLFVDIGGFGLDLSAMNLISQGDHPDLAKG